MSKVYQTDGIFTKEFNDLHDRLGKAVDAIIETEIKPFLTAQNAKCMDVRLINAELRDLVDLYMDSLWLDCLEDAREKRGQS